MGEWKQGNNKGLWMHFTIIQAETRDKVKIIIIFNNIFSSERKCHLLKKKRFIVVRNGSIGAVLRLPVIFN